MQLLAVGVIVGMVEGCILTFKGSRAYNLGNFTGDYSGMSNRITIEDYNDIEYIKNRIDDAIIDFCIDYNISDLKSETQNVFNGCLRYIYDNVFKPNKRNKLNDKVNSLLDYNNIELLIDVLNYYIYLCDIYSKSISVSSFCTMVGIDKTVIYDWYKGSVRNLNPLYSHVFKILDDERERSLSDLLISGKRQPIGLLAVLNHEKNWNLPGSSREIKHVVTSESPQQIAERYRARLADSAGNDSN